MDPGVAQVPTDAGPKPATSTPLDPDRTPIHYEGPDVAIRLKICARNKDPVELNVRSSKEEIQRLRMKDFAPA